MEELEHSLAALQDQLKGLRDMQAENMALKHRAAILEKRVNQQKTEAGLLREQASTAVVNPASTTNAEDTEITDRAEVLKWLTEKFQKKVGLGWTAIQVQTLLKLVVVHAGSLLARSLQGKPYPSPTPTTPPPSPPVYAMYLEDPCRFQLAGV